MALAIVPLTPDRWPDFERSFGRQGACYGCWCTHFRLPPAVRRDNDRARNKDVIKARIEAGPPPGLLAFDDAVPVGWMQIGPRADVPEWNNAGRGSAPLDPAEAADPAVFAISCFFIKSGSRGKGLTHGLVQAGLDFARAQGARCVDACPIDQSRDSRSVGLFVGSTRVFEKAGFVKLAERKNGPPRSCVATSDTPSDAERRSDSRRGVGPVLHGNHAVGQRRQQRPQRRHRHQVEEMRVGDRRAHRNQIVRNVVDEGHRPPALAAQLADGRSLGHLGGQERVGKADLVEMTAAQRAMPVRHRRQQHHLRVPRQAGDRLGCVRDASLPLVLRGEERFDQAAHPLVVHRRPGFQVGNIAVQPEGRQAERQSLCVEEARERADELHKHVIDIEHQERAVVTRQFGDLARRLGIVAHDEPSYRSSPSGSARCATAMAEGAMPDACENCISVGSCAQMKASTPARKPGSPAARRID